MMKDRFLFIDTSSFFMHIAIIEDGEVLYQYKEKMVSDMAANMVPNIKLSFDNVPFGLEDITRIFVVNGPGSYTGIRVGVTAAKVIAWALKKEIVTISSLEYLATTKVDTKYVIPAIDARRGYVYAGVYDSELNIIMDDKHILFSELASYIEEGTLVSRDELEGAIKPEEDVLKVVLKHAKDKSMNPHSVNPNYLKLTEAEERKLGIQND